MLRFCCIGRTVNISLVPMRSEKQLSMPPPCGQKPILPFTAISALKIFALLIFSIGLFEGTNFAANHPDETAPVIREIILIRQNVFSKEDNLLGLGDPFLNSLHFVTRKSIILQELLFKPGDRVDNDLFSETERNLRRLSFIGSVRIEIELNADGSVDVYVYTRDLWTTVFSIEFSRSDSRNEYGLILQEQSLFGYGSPLSLTWDNTYRGNAVSLSHQYHRIRGTRLQLNSFVKNGPSEEYQYFFALNRPLFSLDTKWAFNANINNSNLLRLRDSAGEFLEHSKFQRFTLTRATGSRFRKMIAIVSVFREDAESDTYTQELRELSGRLRLRAFRFAKTFKLDKMKRVEDIELGTSVGAGIARAGDFLGGDRNYWKFSTDQSLAFPSGSRSWILQRVRFTTTLENDNSVNRIWELNIRAYSQVVPRQTIAFRLFAGSRSNLDDRTDIYKLRDRSGLRGYTISDSIFGEKTLLLNLEDRIFSDIHFLTLSFGGVLFLDAGGAWEESEPVKLSDLKYAAGFGFRWEVTKSATARVTRIDFGFPLDGRAISLKNIVISLASGQLFSF